MDYQSCVVKAKVLVKRSEQDQWELAALCWQVCRRDGVTQTQWAADIGVSQQYVSKLVAVHDRYTAVVENDRPTFAEAYATINGEHRAKEAGVLLNLPADRKAEMAARLLNDAEVVRHVVEDNPEVVEAVIAADTERETTTKRDDTRERQREAGLIKRSTDMAQLLHDLSRANLALNDACGHMRDLQLDDHEAGEVDTYADRIKQKVEWLAVAAHGGVTDEQLRDLLANG